MIKLVADGSSSDSQVNLLFLSSYVSAGRGATWVNLGLSMRPGGRVTVRINDKQVLKKELSATPKTSATLQTPKPQKPPSTCIHID